MEDKHLDSADRALQLWQGQTTGSLILSAAKSDFQALVEHGVTIKEFQGELGLEEIDLEMDADDLSTVTVDPLNLLKDALSISEISIDDINPNESSNFLRLSSKRKLPENVQLFFKANRKSSIYELFSRHPGKINFVIHVDPMISDELDNKFLRSIGMQVKRLKKISDLFSDDRTALKKLLDVIHGALTIEVLNLCDPGVQDRIDAYKKAKPSEVVWYSENAIDREFEGATAKIISQMIPNTLPLGKGLIGKPVPDGMLCQEVDGITEVVTYDCKSTQSECYKFKITDADQADRYTEITDRLKKNRWVNKGIVFFTSSLEEATFEARMQKEAWQRLSKNRKLLFIPSIVQDVWQKMCSREEAFNFLFSPELFWSALFDGNLVGVTENIQSKLFPNKSCNSRVVSVADAEICWLSGFGETSTKINAVAKSISKVTSKSNLTGKVSHSQLILQYFKLLRDQKKLTIESLSKALSLSPRSICFLVLSDNHKPEIWSLQGKNTYENIESLVGLANDWLKI